MKQNICGKKYQRAMVWRVLTFFLWVTNEKQLYYNRATLTLSTPTRSKLACILQIIYALCKSMWGGTCLFYPNWRMRRGFCILIIVDDVTRQQRM